MEDKERIINENALNDIRSRELKRFKESLDLSWKTLFDQKLNENVSSRDLAKYCRNLERAQILIDWVVEDLIGKVPLFREEERGRCKWEIYVGAIRVVSQLFLKSYIAKNIFPLLGLEEIGSYLQSFAAECFKTINKVDISFRQAEKYIAHYSWASEYTEVIKKKEQRLCMKYANLKTWEREEEFLAFLEQMEKTTISGIEIFIEGPIKLYLLLGPERFLIILRLLTAEMPLEFKDMDPHLRDAISLSKTVFQLIEKSNMLSACLEVLKTATREHLRIWREEHESIRREFPTVALQRLFVERFENGKLF